MHTLCNTWENGPNDFTLDKSFSLSALFKLEYRNVSREYKNKHDFVIVEFGLKRSFS